MSLAEFQRAFSDLIASPGACTALRNGLETLDGYALTPHERARLEAMVSHRGMSVNCTLYRANRLGPIARALPASCERLGSRLAPLMQDFWSAFPDADLQFRAEARRFAEFLLTRLSDDQALAELVRDELERFDALYSTNPGE